MQAKYGGRDRDRTCDPYHVKIEFEEEVSEYQVVRKPVNGISGTMFRLCFRFLVHRTKSTTFAPAKPQMSYPQKYRTKDFIECQQCCPVLQGN
jgi:hypothetical protein